MLVYRLSPKRYALDLSGYGASKFGGRWNPKGKPVLYTADTPALAMLESLAHYSMTGAPSDLVLVSLKIPDTVTIYKPAPEDYPPDWMARPVRPASVRFGAAWLESAKGSVLRVPSVVTPAGLGWNYILNPMHPELAGRIEVESAVDWLIDPRIATLLP
jgi:RES domain-containing protein